MLTRRIASSLATLTAVLSLAASPVAAEENQDWQKLVKDNSLSEHWTTEGNWQVNDDGVITLKPRPGEEGWKRYDAYLWSEQQYKDFEIEFDYKVQEHGNSGFYFNVGDRGSPVETGIEVQIYDSGAKGQDAKLTDHDSGGIIPGIPPSKNAAKPAGEWNTFHITKQGEQLVVKLNGQTVNEVDLDQPKLQGPPDRGYIGFQDHGLPLALRNVRVRQL